MKTFLKWFIEGMGSIIFYDLNFTEMSDAESLASDWQRVGDDIMKAMSKNQ